MSHGGLTKPTNEVSEWVQSLEAEFLNVHGEEFNYRRNILRELIETFKKNCQGVPHEIITLFARSRIYMRCKYLNKKRVEQAMLQRKERKEARLLKRKGDMSEDLARSKAKKMRKTVS